MGRAGRDLLNTRRSTLALFFFSPVETRNVLWYKYIVGSKSQLAHCHPPDQAGQSRVASAAAILGWKPMLY